jgi:hypothetical protein
MMPWRSFQRVRHFFLKAHDPPRQVHLRSKVQFVSPERRRRLPLMPPIDS